MPRPDWSRLRPGVALVGPLAMLASVLVGWLAFAGASGEEGSVAVGLFVGAGAIVLMAWSFMLAVRLRLLEPFFGGLDRAYQAHRWAGTLAVLLMFLHVRLEPEIDGGIPGASRAVAESAEGLAGVAEYVIYGLVALSLLRWIPYRWWRWTHKALGVPFAFACWHFFTAEKPYANGSPWGWYFGTAMVLGIGAYLWRVVGRDAIWRGRAHTVVGAEVEGTTLDLRLAPRGRRLRFRPGQFAVLKVQERGLSEPHPFTIASAPGDDQLRFLIRDLGDWTDRLQRAELAGARVIVEGPYGRFRPLPQGDRPVIWVAGGVGITPFLSAIADLPPRPRPQRPTLLYCVPTRQGATAMADVERAALEGRIELVVVASGEGRRFSPSLLAEVAGDRLRGAHVAVCGPTGLVRSAAAAARAQGAAEVETEAFDFRSGIGPDLSVPLAELIDPEAAPTAPVGTATLP
ncbi:MAG: ferredoxin reductase family protein [Actinomycetota bacterium]